MTVFISISFDGKSTYKLLKTHTIYIHAQRLHSSEHDVVTYHN